MSQTLCTQCQAPVEPYMKGCRPQHPEWCRLCRRRARLRRYRHSEKGSAAEARYQIGYRQTEKYRVKELRYRMSQKRRAYLARWWRSAKGVTMSRANAVRYARTEQGRAQRARWRQTEQYRAKNRAYVSRRRAQTLSARIIEIVDRRTILKLDAGICHLCELPVDPQAFHVDHLIPIVVEPIEVEFNCAVTHPACNIRKHARFGGEILSPTARARWQARRPAHLAELDAAVARIVAARRDEEAAA
jgi:5-methylcytosine-specific restriction endonuclease McrA